MEPSHPAFAGICDLALFAWRAACYCTAESGLGVSCVNRGVRVRHADDGTRGDGAVDDAALLRLVVAGDADAFAELYDRLAPMVLLRLRRRCRDANAATDVLQETFVAVWRFADSFSGRGEVAAWVWTIAARKLIDAQRRLAVRPVEVAHNVATAETVISAEDVVLADALDAPLAEAINRLSPELRAVLRATVLDGLTMAETAELLDIPVGTVKTRSRRARQLLREALA